MSYPTVSAPLPNMARHPENWEVGCLGRKTEKGNKRRRREGGEKE